MGRQCSSCGGFCGKGGCERENVKPKSEWVGLTIEEMSLIAADTSGIDQLILAVEAKLKEKNT